MAEKSAPLLGLHLLFRQAEVVDDEVLGEFNERVRAAGVENGVRQIGGDFLDPFRRDATGAASPIVFRRRARAGDKEFEMGIFLFQLADFGVEDDVLRLAHGIEDGDFRVELAARGFAGERAERRHTGTAGDADEMLVRLINRQEFSDGRDDEQFVAGLGPIHDARAHFTIALDSHFVKAAIQRAGRKRVGAFVVRRVGPVKRDELAGLEFGIMAVGPFKLERLGVGQFHRRGFDEHFENFFGHKVFKCTERLANFVKKAISLQLH